MTPSTSRTHAAWLDDALPRHQRLTEAVVAILRSILGNKGIEYLAVSGRTKDRKSALEKIVRKRYKEPASDMHDLSGVRVVVYLESDVKMVSSLISNAFNVDHENSSNKDEALSTNQIGYRSVHFVCDLGEKRRGNDEYEDITGLKFEIQVRTVLQHAWAELSHDRKYKFSGRLPVELERRLNLYAGLLEIADKGFDDIALKIDEYSRSVEQKASTGDLKQIALNSVSLKSFVSAWLETNNFQLMPGPSDVDVEDLLEELKSFRVTTLEALAAIIPENYAETAKKNGYQTTVHGLIRNWMLIHDWRRFLADVEFGWVMSDGMLMQAYLPPDEFEEFASRVEWEDE